MSPESAADRPESAPSGRRSFLSWTVKAGVIAVPALAITSSAEAKKPKKNYGRPLPELYSKWDERNFREIQNDENTHVTTIQNALGASAPPVPTFQGLEASTYRQFAQMSQTFENTGVRAYLGALPYINNPAFVTAAGAIALIEAYHSGYLNTLLNTPIAPNSESFAAPAAQAEIVSDVSPFIASLNAPLPQISTTKSDANDIAILQFALILERLESQFYNINVPKFFG